jgi:hypothetical protein
MTKSDGNLVRRSNELYERYGKPLEAEHWGEFLAISPDGRTLLASSHLDALTRARDAFGPGNFIFRVGERVVGRIR